MGFWEKVLPGYKGYKERETARNTDKILREFLASKLREARGHYDDFKSELTRRGNLGLMNPAEKVTQTLGKLMDRLRYANYGFSGRWFGQKIQVDELDKVHEFDKSLVARIEQIEKDIRSLESLDDDSEITKALKSLAKVIRDVDESLNDREQILRTFGGQSLE